MHPPVASGRKRPVNLTLSESLVAQARSYTSNLSATVESLLAEYVVRQQQDHVSRQQLADACAADWNAVHSEVGSFAGQPRHPVMTQPCELTILYILASF